MTYDTMKANVTITVEHKDTAKILVAKLGEIADKEFNNRVTPPTDLSSNQRSMLFLKRNSISQVTSSLSDDKELADKYADTNANPYAMMHQTTKNKT